MGAFHGAQGPSSLWGAQPKPRSTKFMGPTWPGHLRLSLTEGPWARSSNTWALNSALPGTDYGLELLSCCEC